MPPVPADINFPRTYECVFVVLELIPNRALWPREIHDVCHMRWPAVWHYSERVGITRASAVVSQYRDLFTRTPAGLVEARVLAPTDNGYRPRRLRQLHTAITMPLSDGSRDRIFDMITSIYRRHIFDQPRILDRLAPRPRPPRPPVMPSGPAPTFSPQTFFRQLNERILNPFIEDFLTGGPQEPPGDVVVPSAPPSSGPGTPTPIPTGTNPNDMDLTEDLMCVICMDSVRNTARQLITIEPCGHQFHLHCIQKWLLRSRDGGMAYDKISRCVQCQRPIRFRDPIQASFFHVILALGARDDD